MNSWVITIPKTIKWSAYLAEVADASVLGLNLNYRVRFFPKPMEVGDRCYIVHNGRVRGWMRIHALEERKVEWTCETTGATWPAGKYIVRRGNFHVLADGPQMKGFRGVRRYHQDST